HQPAQLHRPHLLLRGAGRAARVAGPPAAGGLALRPVLQLRHDRPGPAGAGRGRGVAAHAAGVVPGDVARCRSGTSHQRPRVGPALVEKGEDVWWLRMLLMSCRVMSRGVGMVLLNHVLRLAMEAGVKVRADFVETGRNRMMQVTYAFAGFTEVARDGAHVVLEADLSAVQPPPSYVRLEIVE